MLRNLFISLLKSACQELGYPLPDDLQISEPPPNFPNADLASNIALPIAKTSGQNPRKIAEAFVHILGEKDEIEAVEVAGPGFLNISFANRVLHQAFQQIGQLPATKPEKISVEYISANPSGPLHIGNARGGPIGETIARVLHKLGHTVVREFYVNDIGGQANRFAESVFHFYRLHFQVASEFPEGGYPGEYIIDLAEQIAREEGDKYLNLSLDEMRQTAIARMVKQIQSSCDRLGIKFDQIQWESQLLESGLSREILGILQKNSATLEKEGALWLKSGLQANDRETVLVKSDGSYTYFLNDLAYHQQKLEMDGCARAVVLLGANHFGHIPRMRAGIQALGIGPERYQGVMYQHVQLKRGNEVVKMAKREGNFVTADEVLDEIPLPVFNWFMLSKAAETHLDFDLQLAKDTSEKNPVYYVQYAHARIHSLLKLGLERGSGPKYDPEHQFTWVERRLLLWLDNYAQMVVEVATTYRTHLIPAYLYELATRFHYFYDQERILSDDPVRSAQLLYLAERTAEIIHACLELMAIEALEKL